MKAAGGLRKAHPASERRTCRLLGMHRSTARSRPEPGRGDGPLATACASWPGGTPATVT